jgi:hypothetical protein
VSRGRHGAPVDRDLRDPPDRPPVAPPPGRRRRRRLVWLLAVLTLVVLLLVTALFVSVGRTLDGDTMVRDGAYTFRLPGSWWPSAGDRGAVRNAVDFYRGPSTAAGRLHVAVTRERRDTTLGELQQIVGFRVGAVAQGRVVKRLSRVRLGGEAAIQVDYTFESKGSPTYARQILCPHAGAVYSVMILAVPYLGSGFDQAAGSVTTSILRTWGWSWRWT